jgi:hypothetical protein
MNEDFKKQIASKISEEEILHLKGWVLGVDDWEHPSSEDLVKISALQQMILMKGFVNDESARFELLDVAEMAGLTLHEFAMYCEIGNWIAMDRRFSEMDSEEVDEFYETMEELLNEINEDEAIEEVFTSSMNTAVERVDEINELNHLFYEK